ncbi:MAG: signal peptidase I [Clostridia bacterium]
MKVAGKILSILSYILLAVVLVIFVTVLVARIRNEIPTLFGYSFHLVVSPSMETENEDSIEIGDMVIVKHCDSKDIAMHDIILFVSQDPSQTVDGKPMKILHRVVGYANEEHTSFITKGDNNSRNDDYPSGELIGKMAGKSRAFGAVMLFFMKGTNIIFLLLIIVLVVFMAVLIAKLVTSFKKAKPNDEEQVMRQEIMEKIKKEQEESNNDKVIQANQGDANTNPDNQNDKSGQDNQ